MVLFTDCIMFYVCYTHFKRKLIFICLVLTELGDLLLFCKLGILMSISSEKCEWTNPCHTQDEATWRVSF